MSGPQLRFTAAGLRRARTLTVAGFVAAVALVFGVLWVNMGGQIPHITGGYRVTASLPKAQNLVYDSDVRIAGVPVGKIRGITHDGDRVLATMEIRGSAHPLHEGATVQLRPKTLIEETYVEVTDGQGPAIPDGARLPDTAAVPSVSVDDLLNSLDPPTRAAVGSLVRRLGTLTDGQAQNLSTALSALGDLGREGHDALDVLAAQSQDLQGLVAQTAALLSTLDEGEGQIARLATAAEKVTAASAVRDDKLAQAVRLLPGFLADARTAAAPLSQLSAALTPLADPLRRAAPDLDAALAELPGATSALRGLLPSLDVVLARSPDTLARTPAVAADVDSLIPPLQMALSDLNPMLGYLAPYGQDLASVAANVGQVFNAVGPAGPQVRILVIVNEKSFTGDLPVGTQIGPLQKSNPYPAPGTAAHPQQFSGPAPRVPREP
ncbi:MAG TPA: MlaD family protein [Acidimicrobiia bacterium]|nr:MlaD family protein [Acidimicrobiia bacterium]